MATQQELASELFNRIALQLDGVIDGVRAYVNWCQGDDPNFRLDEGESVDAVILSAWAVFQAFGEHIEALRSGGDNAASQSAYRDTVAKAAFYAEHGTPENRR